MSKYIDSNGLLYYHTQVMAIINNKNQTKVDKVIGKDLSTNDLTNDLKAKYDAAYTHSTNAHAPSSAQENIIEYITVNGAAVTPVSKVVALAIPTKTSEILNDSNFAIDASYNHTDNNFTNAYLNKLDNIAAGAEVNVITGIKVNGITSTPTNKVINIVVPTKLSDLTNDNSSVTDSAYVHTDNNYTTDEKTKLSGIEAGAQANIITGIKVNGVASSPVSKIVSLTIPTKLSDLTNDSGYLTSHQDITGKADKATTLAGYGIADAYTKSDVDSKLSSTYKAAGSSAFADLPTPSATVLGFTYNVTDDFVTTIDFVIGADKSYPAGTNVTIVLTDASEYKYDVLAGFYDLSGYIQIADSLTNAEIDAIIASVA